MRSRIVASIVALAGAAAACGGGASSAPRATGSPALERCEPRGLVSVGETLPLACEFERLSGGTFALRDLTGRPLVLNFWASWCTFCIAEMPDFQSVYADTKDRIELVGMNLLNVKGESRADARRFARSTGVRYPLAYDRDGLLYAHFSLRFLMPTTVFVDARGIVRFRQFGPLDADRLRGLLKEHLGIS